MKRILILVCIVIATIALCAETPQELFTRATQAYDQGHYRDALGLFLELEDMGIVDTDLYFNLGNTYFRLHQTGRAVLYYKRALAVDPNNEHAANNLTLIAGDLAKPAQAADADADYLSMRLRDLYEWLPLNALAVILTLLLAGVVAMLHWLFHRRQDRDRTVPVFVLGVVIVLWLGLGILALSRWHDYANRVFDQKVRTWTVVARRAPDAAAAARFTAHRGQALSVVSESGAWSRVMMADGREGWMPTAAWQGDSEAVVLKEQADVYSGPDKQREILYSLPEGYVVKVQQEHEGWARVTLTDGAEGWMEATDYEKVESFNDGGAE